jgi:hypothetical protein
MKLVSKDIIFCVGDIGNRMNFESLRVVCNKTHNIVRDMVQEAAAAQFIIWSGSKAGGPSLTGPWFYQVITVEGSAESKASRSFGI